MVKNTGIICVMYYTDNRYTKLAKVAHDSFVKFHKDEVATFVLTPENYSEYTCSKFTTAPGIMKYMLAYEIAKKHDSKKIIILGADTITCSRLDEFIDDNDHDILTTLDYPYQLVLNRHPISPDSETHLNADVICFNNIKALKAVIKASLRHRTYFEQGGLNEVVWLNKEFTNKTVDSPYDQSTVVYNVRSKGNMCLPYAYQDHSATTGKPPKFPPYEKPWSPHLNKFYVKDKKLYTKDHKQIKVWHYCEGFGNMKEDDFKKIMNNYIFNWFNEETKKFFKEECDCGDFFDKEFTF